MSSAFRNGGASALRSPLIQLGRAEGGVTGRGGAISGGGAAVDVKPISVISAVTMIGARLMCDCIPFLGCELNRSDF